MRYRFILIVAGLLAQMSALHAQVGTWDNSNVSTSTMNGNVGIGTQSPTSPLTVIGVNDEIGLFKSNSANNTRVVIRNQTGDMNIGTGSVYKYGYLWSSTGRIFFGDDGNPTMWILGTNNGTVGIGTDDTKGYKLGVNGNAIFNKVVVKQYPWADYVFQPEYRLRPLSEVEQYIKEHHHLPEVVSAEEVEKNGLDVGDNQATLLKKIEELTLYMIDQSKKQQALADEVAELKRENKELKELMPKKK